MFIISQSETYTWPVKVEIPVAGGRFEVQTFDAEFKRISQSRFKEIMDQINEQDSKLTDADLAKEVTVGWKGVSDGGSDIPFLC
jgi:hypothetical protein